MDLIDLPFNKVKCNPQRYNQIEVKFWKKQFLSKNPIPSPWIDENNKITAFHNCYFTLKELGFSKTKFILQSK